MKPIASMAAILLLAPLVISAFQEEPMPGVTGGFGESTCQKCHFDNPLDDPAGSLRVAGIPSSYVPGRAYEVTITLSRRGALRGGFQLAARIADGGEAGSQAGRLQPAGPDTQVISSNEHRLDYAQHGPAGTRAGAEGSLSWKVVWTAPDPPVGSVVFHAAANAGNDDASPLGDFVYLSELKSRAARR